MSRDDDDVNAPAACAAAEHERRTKMEMSAYHETDAGERAGQGRRSKEHECGLDSV